MRERERERDERERETDRQTEKEREREMRECKGAGQAHTARDRRDCSRISGTLRHDISTHSGRCLLFSCAAYKSEFVSAAAQGKGLTFSLTSSVFRTRCFEGERREIGWVRRGAGRLVRGGKRGGGWAKETFEWF